MRCYLVRHCEKVDWGDDPPLTPAGQRRARALARSLAKSLDVVPLRKVIVTTLRRTLETAQPSIDELATRSTSPPQLVRLSPGSYARVVDEVWEQQDGASLVVGHMQTIPALVRRIAARVPATSRSSLALPDFVRYGDLFVLDGDDAGSLSLTALRFGDDAPW